jgi:hypothetical protein
VRFEIPVAVHLSLGSPPQLGRGTIRGFGATRYIDKDEGQGKPEGKGRTGQDSTTTTKESGGCTPSRQTWHITRPGTTLGLSGAFTRRRISTAHHPAREQLLRNQSLCRLSRSSHPQDRALCCASCLIPRPRLANAKLNSEGLIVEGIRLACACVRKGSLSSP